MKKTGLLLLAIMMTYMMQAQTSDSCKTVQVSDSNFVKVGAATHLSANRYILTPDTRYVFGGIWYQNKIDLNNDFYLEFDLNFGTKDAGGADGMAFVLQPLSTNQGGDGGRLGYGGIAPSIGVEYDDWNNTNFNDPAQDHIAIFKNGDVYHPTGYLDPSVGFYEVPNMEDGLDKNTIIEWIAATNTLNVYYQGTLVRSVTQDIINTVFGGSPDVYWGWTAGTGAAYNLQTVNIKAVQFNESLQLSATSIATSCSNNDGSIDLSVLPLGTYAYNWSNGATTEDIQNLTAGTYSVFVSTSNGCKQDTISVDVLSTSDLAVNIQAGENCNTTEFITNGSLNDTTAWTDCNREINYPETVYGGSDASNIVAEIDYLNSLCQTIQGLTIGSQYTLSFDASGRTHSCAPDTQVVFVHIDGAEIGSVTRRRNTFGFVRESFTFFATSSSHAINISTDSNFTATCGMIIDNVSIKQVCGNNADCSGLQGGNLVANIIGGVAPFSYLWNTGDTNPTVGNLAAGNYSLTVVDANGCTATNSYTLQSETDSVPPSLVCSSQTLQLDAYGFASLDLTSIFASDDCLLDTLFASSIDTFFCEQVGLVDTITVTAIDVAGNVATCQVEITIADDNGNCDNCYKGNTVSPFSCSNCTSVVPTNGWYFVPANDTVCLIEKNNGGIHFGNNSTLVVCGNVSLQGLDLTQGTKVIINGSLTVNHINFNSGSAVLENYGILTVLNGMSIRGTVTNFGSISIGQTLNINNPDGVLINNGNISVNQDLNNSYKTYNNGLLEVGNTLHVNSNATLENNCTVDVDYRFIVNAGTHFTNDGLVEVTDKAIFNNAQFTVMPKSVISADGGDFNNSVATNPNNGCAFIEITDRSQFNQATFTGDIAYCDQNTVIEINNNSVFSNGASLSCNGCGGSSNITSPTVTALNLRVQPNPINNGDFVTINYNSGHYYLSITDIYGSVKENRNVSQGSTTLHLVNYTSGIYILHLHSNTGISESIQFEVR